MAAAVERTARKAMLAIVLALAANVDIDVKSMAILSDEPTSSGWCHRPDVVPIEPTTGTTTHSRIKLLHRTQPHVAARTCGGSLRQSLVL